MRLSMKFRIGLILAIIALVTISAVLRAYLVSPRVSEIEASIRSIWASSGDQVTSMKGNPSFQVLPPEFVLSDAQITTERGTMLKAEHIRFGFKLSALLTGSYDIASIEVNKAEIILSDVEAKPDTQTAENFLIAFVSYFERQASIHKTDQVEVIRLNDAYLKTNSSAQPFELQLASAELTRDRNGTLALSADTAQATSPIKFQMQIGQASPDMAKGRETEFLIRTTGLELSGRGATAFDDNLQFLGSVSIKAETIEKLGAFIKTRIATPVQMEMLLDAKARLSFSGATFSDMRLRLGSSDITGNLMADFALDPPHLTGTLAASSLDLSNLVDAFGLKRDTFGKLSTAPWPKDIVPNLDIDLRLSSDKILFHDIVMTGAALSTLIRDRKAELTLASANLFEGDIAGKIRIDSEEETNRYQVSTNLSFNGIDIERAGISLFDSKRVGGISSGQLDLKSEGSSSDDFMRLMTGRIDINVEQNSITGLDLLAFLHRVEARPIGAVLGLKNGTTFFDQGRISLQIDQGLADIKTAKFTKFPDLQVRLGGKIDFAKSQFAISGNAMASSAQSTERSIDLPFSLQGPFDDPAFIPDFTNVTKQSGAIIQP